MDNMDKERFWKGNLETYERISSLVEGAAGVSILSMVILLAKDERVSIELFREDSEKIEIAFLYVKKMIEERKICVEFKQKE